MQKFKTAILIIVIASINSCQFNQSVKKDLKTGAYSKGNGIGIEEILIEINGEAENRNEFVFGEEINIIFRNVNGLKSSDKKTFPGISMYIIKNKKDTVLSHPNLLKNGTDLSPLELRANFTTALPHRNNEKYELKIEIWDKKGNGKFNYELPFEIKKNNLLELKNNGVKYSNIYLWNETLKRTVSDNNISSKHQFILILNEIEGLKLTNGKVFPIFSIDLQDKNGNKLLSNPNLLSDYEKEGVNPEDLKSQLFAKLSFTNGKINNPCKLVAKLKDRNSLKEINISSELNIN
tara:strand:- start:48 stop:923 length:876 start_codon:yes stop_codon:yes gene_type:complete